MTKSEYWIMNNILHILLDTIAANTISTLRAAILVAYYASTGSSICSSS